MRPAPAAHPMPRFDERDPCGGETVIDLALCLILAVAVVSLLLLAAF
ncbi:hypothetical protein [Methylobacterium sp. Leaf456]|nr:hypothetical protein [Methylobacterium sp. Leaf456]